MQNIKLIIGANYGDEGKGLAADYFGARAAGKFNTINVLTNGGPQRGHTVELADGRLGWTSPIWVRQLNMKKPFPD